MALVGVVGVAEVVALELELELAEVAADGVCVAGAEDGGGAELPLVQAARTRQAEAAA